MKRTDDIVPIMKIQKSMRFEPTNPFYRMSRMLYTTLMVCLLSAVTVVTVNAQCDGLAVACNNIIQVSLDTSCTAFITPDVMLEDPQADTSLYEVRVYDPDGKIIPGDIIREDYDNVKLKVEVECKASGIWCWGYIIVEDKIKPTIKVEPSDTAVTCFLFPFDFDPVALTTSLLATDNGCEKPEICEPVDIVQEYKPCADTVRTITRLWTAKDKAGNTCTDTQYIYILRASIDQVVFPADTTVDCLDEADLSVAKLGEPEIRSCDNFLMEHEDIEIPVCGVSRKILRIWKVTDTCTDEDSVHTQVIKIEDNYPPEFDFTFFKLSPEMLVPDRHSCTATARNIPNPIITDCNLAQTTLEVFYQLVDENNNPTGALFPGQVNSLELFDLVNVPIGAPFVVIFVANDGCGNISRDTSDIIMVSDTSPPNAVCEGSTTVVLNSVSGEVEVLAETFDDHSTDNCGVVRKEVRRLDNACPGYLSDLAFQNKIHFCCSDIPNNPVRVVFRVYDAAGNFSDCIVKVYVQDKRQVDINCKAGLTFNCDFDLNNLEAELLKASNLPDVTWVCGEKSLTVDIPDYQLNDCGLGSFSVKWVAMDVNGQMDSCFQQVTIENQNTPTITWPTSTINLSSCQGTSPDELNSKPVITNVDCEQIATTYEDQVLKGTDPTYCVKIVRKWSVIDWCKFNGGNTASAIIGTRDQTIKISDREEPQLLTSCLPFEVVDTDKTCSAFVDLSFKAKDDCTKDEDLVYSYEIDLDSDGNIDDIGAGSDASGVFPVGEHTINISVEDQCGNITHCMRVFRVVTTKEPIPVCQAVMQLELDSEGSASIVAEHLNLKSTTGCGSEDGLTFSFDPEGFQTDRTFTCADIPNGVFNDVEVQLWITDTEGNQEYCTVTVALSDRVANFCANDTSGANVTGTVTDENLASTANIEVSALNTRTGRLRTTTTADDGSYSFELNMFDEYFITPKLGGFDMTGVSTLDVVYIQQHILGLRRLTSPFKMLAADVNNSNSITAADLVELRRLILGTIPSLNQSWKFVNESFVFTDLEDPWVYPSGIVLNELSGAVDGQSFIGLKVGDVNGNAFAALAKVLSAPRTAKTLQVMKSENERRVTYAIRTDETMDLAGFQMSFDYDRFALEFSGAESGRIDLSGDHYYADREKGNLNLSWTTPAFKQVSGEWFFLHFSKRRPGPAPDLSLNSKRLHPEVYESNLEVSRLSIETLESEQSEDEFTLYQNTPNPFNDHTAIRFYLPSSGNVELTVVDVSGKMIYRNSAELKKGQHQFDIRREDLRGSGIYYYTLTSDTDKKTRRMIVLY